MITSNESSNMLKESRDTPGPKDPAITVGAIAAYIQAKHNSNHKGRNSRNKSAKGTDQKNKFVRRCFRCNFSTHNQIQTYFSPIRTEESLEAEITNKKMLLKIQDLREIGIKTRNQSQMATRRRNYYHG